MRDTLASVADVLDRIANGEIENIHALNFLQHIQELDARHKLCARRWAAGVPTLRDPSGLRRVARRLRELDPEYGVGEMVVKERYGIQLKNGTFVLDETNNAPRMFTTKRQAHLEFGADANVQPMRCTFEVIVRAKLAGKPKPKRK